MLSFITQLISWTDPLNTCLKSQHYQGKWEVATLTPGIDIVYVIQKDTKGQAITDHLDNKQVEDYEPMASFSPDEYLGH